MCTAWVHRVILNPGGRPGWTGPHLTVCLPGHVPCQLSSGANVMVQVRWRGTLPYIRSLLSLLRTASRLNAGLCMHSDSFWDQAASHPTTQTLREALLSQPEEHLQEV